ncbi:Putative Integral membrane protein [Penicillium brasilianum]|uniref:Putative Integral membrane protein n=1 Tax=Penicillium brasilianum TaxID=104259 RepID=A0A0F7TV04_PENBI|nr:Putative Integral membrane protein [Penicillium brasilianum]
MQLPSLAVMATWPTPNYVDPPTRGHGALIVNVVCISLAFLVVMLRLYTRLRITCSAGVDDVLIVIGLAFAIAMVVVTSLATENWGWNRHIWDVPVTWLSTLQKLNIVFQIMFSWSSSLTKISLLWFCRRLLGAGKGNFRWFNWSFIGSIIVVGFSCIMFTFISVFQCSPIKAYWDVSPTYPYKCLDGGSIVFSASVINIFTDFLVTALPMPLIWRLKLPARQRLAVISIFGLGIIVNVAGSVRTVYVWKSMVVAYDTTWLGWPVLIAASVEINLGLICSSAPALRPLIATFLPRLLNSTRNKASSYNQRSRSQKLFSSTGRSRHTHMPGTQNSRKGDFESDRFEIMRTVEMETWTESRLAHHDAIGHTFDIGTHNRASTPESIEMKHGGAVFSSAASEKSSSSLTRDEAFYGRR